MIKGMRDEIKRRAALKDIKANKAAARKAKRDATRAELLAGLHGKARAAWANQPAESDCKDTYLRTLRLKQVRAICNFTHPHLTGKEAKKTLNFRRGGGLGCESKRARVIVSQRPRRDGACVRRCHPQLEVA